MLNGADMAKPRVASHLAAGIAYGCVDCMTLGLRVQTTSNGSSGLLCFALSRSS